MALEILGSLLEVTVIAGLMIAGLLAVVIWIRNKTVRITYLRTVVQITSLVAIFASLPLLALWPSLVIAIVVFITIFFGRFFCGWICPFGLYMDIITFVRKAMKISYRNLPKRLNEALHKLRYAIVAIILLLPFFLGSPFDLENWRSFFLFEYQYKPLMIVFLGPLEPLVIPWSGVIGYGGYSLSYPYVRGITEYFPQYAITISIFLFVFLTIISSFFVRRSWCRFCPTGVSIAAIDRFKRSRWIPLLHLHKTEEKCTKCGICDRVCPLQVTEIYEQKGGELTTSMCMLCMRCVEMCPEQGCLKVNVAGKSIVESRNWLEPSRNE